MTEPSRKIALVAVTDRGLEQARLLRRRLRTGAVCRPDRHGPPCGPWEHAFAGALSEQMPALFAEFDQLVFFLAVGAATRLLAPCLSSKTSDPGVLAVDEAGRFVVPVLSGHQGGANAFARTVAGCLGATPVITTASDVIGGLSPDLLGSEFGWTAEPADRLKAAAAALVNGQPVAIIQEIGGPGGWLDERELPGSVTFVKDVAALPEQPFAGVLWITDRLVDDCRSLDPEHILWYRPDSLVLGVGCERGISAEALEDALDHFLGEHRYSRHSIRTLATVDVKADEEAILEVARRHGWHVEFYPAEELARVPGLPNPSPVVEKCIGTPGVAEPAALLASGAERLLVEKQVMTSPLSPRRMTFALARSAAYQPACAQGKVVFIGAGPGDPDLLTLKARHILQKAGVVIYAGSLIPEAVLRQASPTAVLHNSAHLTLEEITELTVAAVRSGRTVARLQSGDTSLYSAIQEQMTRLDEAGINYDVVPGVSSFQAAAAALRSELTLPEVVQTVILTRAEGQTKMPAGEELEALARHGATLCIFLSARLTEQVQEHLLAAYPPETPVAIASRVSWPDEQIVVTELRHLHEEVRRLKLVRTTLLLVGKAVGGRRNRSRLYDKHHGHLFRARGHDQDHPPA